MNVFFKMCVSCRHYSEDTDHERYCRAHASYHDPVTGQLFNSDTVCGSHTQDPMYFRSRWWLCVPEARWFEVTPHVARILAEGGP